MKKKLLPIPLVLAACTGHAFADATLTYQLSGPEGAQTTKTFAIARFFARVDDSAEKDSYLLYQAGKFFPLFEVNPAARAYTRLTTEVKPTLRAGVAPSPAPAAEQPDAQPAEVKPAAPAETPASAAPDAVAETASRAEAAEKMQAPVADAAEPAGTTDKPVSGKPELRPTRQKREVAGVECRVIEELRDGKPVMEHCMANKARLGMTERETRTLARTFTMARERDLGWLGAATEDEDFVSIQARDLASERQLVLQGLSTAPLPQGHLRIPREYKQTNP